MKRHILLATVVGMLLLLLGIFISIQNGAKQIPLSDIISVFFSSADTLHSQLILDVRLPRLLASIPVSYTHLDVYKRQDLHMITFFKFYIHKKLTLTLVKQNLFVIEKMIDCILKDG